MFSPHKQYAKLLPLLLALLLPLSAAAAQGGASRSQAGIGATAASQAPAAAPMLTPRAAQLVKAFMTRLFGADDDDHGYPSGHGGDPSGKDGSGMCPHGGGPGH